MANWSNLKSSINSVIKTNANQEITGQVLQNVLNTIVSTLGENASFVGVATPTTNPGTPDGNVFYIAQNQGIYPNFNNIEVYFSEIGILYWNTSSWGKHSIRLSKLIEEVNISNIYPTGGMGGSNKYTLETAIAKVGEELRHAGLKVTFLNEEGTTETWEYQGGTFTSAESWIQCGAKILTELGGYNKKNSLMLCGTLMPPIESVTKTYDYSYFKRGYYKKNGILEPSRNKHLDLYVNNNTEIKIKAAYEDTLLQYASFIVGFDINNNIIEKIPFGVVSSGEEYTYVKESSVVKIGVSAKSEDLDVYVRVTENKEDYIYGVGTEQIQDGSITTEKLQDGSITTEKLQDGSITFNKLSDDLKECYSPSLDDILTVSEEQFSAGYYMWGSGYIADKYQKHTELIPVNEGDIIIANVCNENTLLAIVAAFDQNGTYLQSKSVQGVDIAQNENTIVKYIVPSGVYKVGVSTYSQRVNSGFYVKLQRINGENTEINGEKIQNKSVSLSAFKDSELEKLRIITNQIIIVRRNGTVGVDCDFSGLNGIHEALESIKDNSYTKRYIIKVYGHFIFNTIKYYDEEGEDITEQYWTCMAYENSINAWFANVYGKDYVTIDGINRDDTSIEVYIDENTEFPSYSNDSEKKYNGTNFHVLFNNSVNSIFKNITFVGVNTRYCVHTENASESYGCYCLFEDCDFKYKKNITFAEGYNSPDVLGLGLRGNMLWEIKRCRFFNSAKGGTIGGHSGYTTDVNKLKELTPAKIIISNCGFFGNSKIINMGSYYPLRDVIILNGCNLMKQAKVNISTNYNQSNKPDIVKLPFIISDKPVLVNVITSNKVLKFSSKKQGTKIRILPTCSIYSKIISYGDYSNITNWETSDSLDDCGAFTTCEQNYKDGTGCFVFSSRYFSVKADGSDTLGLLIGDCTSNNKELTVLVDGEPYTYVFNQDFTAMSDDNIISLLNNSSIFGENVQAEIIKESDFIYPQVGNISLCLNISSKKIEKGKAIICGGYNSDANTSTMALATGNIIDGICIDETPTNSWGRVMFNNNSLFDRNILGSLSSGIYKINSDGNYEIATSKEEAVIRVLNDKEAEII